MSRSIKSLLAAAFCVAGLPSATSAALIHDFQFTDGLANSVAGGPALQTSWRAGVTGAVSNGLYAFQQGAGLSLNSGLPGGVYTIEIGASLGRVTGYNKLLTFKTLEGNDNGLYVDDTVLNLYGLASSAVSDFAANTPFTVTLTRNAAGLVTGYVNGAERFSRFDANGDFTATGGLFFLRDDLRQNYEDSAGSADFIRIHDTVEVPTVPVPGPIVGAVPEPATWAMMLLGFGAVGYSMRRSKKTPQIAYAI